MGRKKSLIKQTEVARAARGLLAGAAAVGMTGDIEISLETGIIKFRLRQEPFAPSQAKDSETNEWDSVV